MRELIENKQFDEERALYGKENVLLRHVSFDGAADGESALKEARDVVAEDCFCNLRYPFWHVKKLKLTNVNMTELCRAAIWYSSDIEAQYTKFFGIKAVRECSNVKIFDSSINSPEFGWFTQNVELRDTVAKSEYFFLRSKNLRFENVKFTGKYSFQYVENAVFENCEFDTKDAFWHGKNIVLKNCIVRGEYLAWYADGITFDNCTLEGTQPLCYCKNIIMKQCKMYKADLCFEKSFVQAEITTPVVSIKNPYGGHISLPSLGEKIVTDPKAKAVVTVKNN